MAICTPTALCFDTCKKKTFLDAAICGVRCEIQEIKSELGKGRDYSNNSFNAVEDCKWLKAKTYDTDVDSNLKSNDGTHMTLTSQKVAGGHISECKSICDQTKNCGGFVRNGATCYFKQKTAKFVDSTTPTSITYIKTPHHVEDRDASSKETDRNL